MHYSWNSYFHVIARYFVYFWKWNFPTSPHVRLSNGRSFHWWYICWSVIISCFTSHAPIGALDTYYSTTHTHTRNHTLTISYKLTYTRTRAQANKHTFTLWSKLHRLILALWPYIPQTDISETPLLRLQQCCKALHT